MLAEDLASMYWDKRQLESVCMRILSSAQVTNTRELGNWLSYDDLNQMVERAIDTPTTGFTLVYGLSNNDRAPVDNALASYLYHGGPFAAIELGNSGIATIDIPDDRKKI